MFDFHGLTGKVIFFVDKCLESKFWICAEVIRAFFYETEEKLINHDATKIKMNGSARKPYFIFLNKML